jgi:hypothetical protein
MNHRGRLTVPIGNEATAFYSSEDVPLRHKIKPDKGLMAWIECSYIVDRTLTLAMLEKKGEV